MQSYQIFATKYFSKKLRNYKKKDRVLGDKIFKVMDIMSDNPFKSSLKTHTVNSRNFAKAYSSRVTGDIRIIWDFKGNKVTIMLLDVGSHNQVY